MRAKAHEMLAQDARCPTCPIRAKVESEIRWQAIVVT
jgi:hypothetical protein